jgi:hypothetical protein
MKILFHLSPVHSDDNIIALTVEAAATFRHVSVSDVMLSALIEGSGHTFE